MNPLAIVGLISTIAQGIPEIEAAIGALTALANGTTPTPADFQALGQAVIAAHNRVQGLAAAPAAAPAVNAGTVSLVNPPKPAA
jgi:hypothetical protein